MEGHSFGSIGLAGRGGVATGQLKLTPGGLLWKKAGGGKSVELKKADIDALYWTKVPRGCQMGVRLAAGDVFNFLGFRDNDLTTLSAFCRDSYSQELKEQQMSTTGRNWGALAVDAKTLRFSVDGRATFGFSLSDISGGSSAKDDVMLELHTDDTAAGDKEDVLTEIAFYVPPGNTDFPADGEESAAKALLAAVLAGADVEAASSDDAVAQFEGVSVQAPRGRFEIEMHLQHLSLVGLNQEFKVRYSSIVRVFVLPKSSTPHTMVVLSLDPPIRKGQTYYPHVLCQFPSDEEVTVDLNIGDEALAAKNEKCGGKLARSYSGPVWDVFAKIVRGMTGVRVTKPGTFRSGAGEAAVRCSYKAEDGYLYPLERAFFYIQKPPLLIPHDEIDSIEFQRQGGGMLAGSVKTFDLVFRLKGDAEHQFRNIQRSEWQPLFEFFQAKRIKIENLAAAKQGPAGGNAGVDLAEAYGLDSEDEDEDFEAGSAGSDDDDDEFSDASADAGSDDAEMIDEEGIDAGDMGGKKKRKRDDDSGTPKAKKPKAPKAPKAEAGEKGAKKPRKKKDPNAPKKALSAFMFFSNAMRDTIKSENPGIAFGEVGKLLGERWKALPAEDKVQYEEKARQDKTRYQAAMKEYAAKQSGKVDADAVAADDDDDDEEAADEE